MKTETKAKRAKAPAKAKAPPYKAPPVKRKVGRPSSYKEEYAELAYKFCLLGATDTRLAEMFEVDIATIHHWKTDVPEFLSAVKEGREWADANVAKSLYHRAIGYSHQEDDIRTLSVGGGRSEIVITPTVKHYPPDTTAAIFWLKNRRPEQWRETKAVELTGKDGGPVETITRIELVDMDDDSAH